VVVVVVVVVVVGGGWLRRKLFDDVFNVYNIGLNTGFTFQDEKNRHLSF